MELKRELLEMEEKFWTAGADFYERCLSPEFLLVIPGMGIVGRGPAIEGIAEGSRWTHVEMSDLRLSKLTEGVAVVTYGAEARREDEDLAYRALISSVYVHEEGSWKLAFHHQSPLE